MLDGRTLGANPYEEDVLRDDAPHVLTVRADGFETREIDARLSRDVNVDVTLAPRGASSTTPTFTAASAPPAASVVRRPGPRPPAQSKGSAQRQIDEDDPYKP
jgi:hypothetical protein